MYCLLLDKSVTINSGNIKRFLNPHAHPCAYSVRVNNLKKLNQHNSSAMIMQGIASYHDKLVNNFPSAKIYMTEVLPVRALYHEEIVQ